MPSICDGVWPGGLSHVMQTTAPEPDDPIEPQVSEELALIAHLGDSGMNIDDVQALARQLIPGQGQHRTPQDMPGTSLPGVAAREKHLGNKADGSPPTGRTELIPPLPTEARPSTEHDPSQGTQRGSKRDLIQTLAGATTDPCEGYRGRWE